MFQWFLLLFNLTIVSFEIRRNDRLDEINQLLTKHVFHDNYTNGSYARVKMCETNIDPCYNLQVCYLFKTLKNTKFTTLWVQRNFETIDLRTITYYNWISAISEYVQPSLVHKKSSNKRFLDPPLVSSPNRFVTFWKSVIRGSDHVT